MRAVRAASVALALVLSADVAVVAARSGGTPAARPGAPAARASAKPVAKSKPRPKPKPKPLPPLRVLVSVKVGDATPRVVSVTGGGQALRTEPKQPAAPAHTVSRTTRKVVASEVLKSNDFYGCGVAGCSTTTFTEAGITIRNLDGKRKRTLTKGGYDSEPSFAPDGSAIAYLSHSRNKAGNETDVIALMGSDGAHYRTYRAPGNGTYAAPMWSPDGRWIAAVERQPAGAKVRVRVVLLPVGSGARRTVAEGEFEALRWAPSGDFLVARAPVTAWSPSHSMRLATGHDLWHLPVRGKAKPRRLTHQAPARWVQDSAPGRFCERSVYWLGVTEFTVSPDSTLVAFASNTPHHSRAGVGFDVLAVRTDGSGLRTVYRSARPTCAGYMQPRATVATPIGWTR